MEESRWCVGQLASHYEVTTKTIYEWLRDGKLPGRLRHKTPSGRSYWIASEVIAFDSELQKVTNRDAM